MSSMLRHFIPTALFLLSAPALAASLTPDQQSWYRARLGVPGGVMGSTIPASPNPLAESILRWDRLRQSGTFSFSEYAAFLLTNREWPGAAQMRKSAEERLDPNSYVPSEVVRFFDAYPPLTNGGKARYALALADYGRADDARNAARNAWISGALNPDDESRLMARFPGVFSTEDHDKRIDRLLWQRAVPAAQRLLGYASPDRRVLFEARIALQTKAPDALSKVAAVREQAGHDSGLLVDKVRYYRALNAPDSAQSVFATAEKPDRPPADPAIFLDTLLALAKSAAVNNEYNQVKAIALRADDAYAPGTAIRDRPLGERDDYTSLMWLAGRAAQRLGKHGDAIGFYARYGDAARTAQTRSKGYYWAGRSAEAHGRKADATAYYEAAARYFDHFHGQLALERMGRPLVLPKPGNDPTLIGDRDVNPQVVDATRLLGELGAWQIQSQFLRALAGAVDDGASPAPLEALAREIGRPDLGVMAARKVDDRGNSAYLDYGFPKVAVPPNMRHKWTMIHAISRQESQFDRQIISHAGARGLMQLMPGTARETAGKIGIPYDFMRLTDDPQYNILLGSTYFSNLLDLYGGNHVLAVAAYNSGPGNVRKFINANGDPRSAGVDVVEWIESIPLTETRGYVYRVLENAVIYDALNPDRRGEMPKAPLSRYLGKLTPG